MVLSFLIRPHFKYIAVIIISGDPTKKKKEARKPLAPSVGFTNSAVKTLNEKYPSSKATGKSENAVVQKQKRGPERRKKELETGALLNVFVGWPESRSVYST